MAINLIRETSATPNITNKIDARMIRYAYAGQNGVIKNYANQCSYTIDGSNFKVNSGILVLQGWECEIDSNGVTVAVDNVATLRYFSVYLEVNLSTETAQIKSTYSTTGYPTISAGDDLTTTTTGTARLELYRFTAINGVITYNSKLFETLVYILAAIEDGTVVAANATEAAQAVKLKTGRLIDITGGVTATATSFNGTTDINIPITALNPAYLSAGTAAINISGLASTAGKIVGSLTSLANVGNSGTTFSGTAGYLYMFSFYDTLNSVFLSDILYIRSTSAGVVSVSFGEHLSYHDGKVYRYLSGADYTNVRYNDDFGNIPIV